MHKSLYSFPQSREVLISHLYHAKQCIHICSPTPIGEAIWQALEEAAWRKLEVKVCLPAEWLEKMDHDHPAYRLQGAGGSIHGYGTIPAHWSREGFALLDTSHVFTGVFDWTCSMAAPADHVGIFEEGTTMDRYERIWQGISSLSQGWKMEGDPVLQFQAEKRWLPAGGKTRLHYELEAGYEGILIPMLLPIQGKGSIEVQPGHDTHYQVEVKKQDKTWRKSVRVRVAWQPQILLEISPQVVRPGDQVRLQWVVTHADEVWLSPLGKVAKQGVHTWMADHSQEIILKAKGINKTVQERVRLTVLEEPHIPALDIPAIDVSQLSGGLEINMPAMPSLNFPDSLVIQALPMPVLPAMPEIQISEPAFLPKETAVEDGGGSMFSLRRLWQKFI